MDYSRMTKQELITLLTLREKPVACNNPQTAFDYLRPYASTEQENFVLLMLDGAHNIKNVKLITKGLINRTLVHPREIFAPAIENRATAVILSHCHPSGNLEPSSDDLECTYRLKKAGELLGIPVLDHLIFSNTGFRSMAENGDLF